MYGKHETSLFCPNAECGDEIEIEVEYVGKGSFDPDTYAEDTEEVVTILNRNGCECPDLAGRIGQLWNNEAESRWMAAEEAKIR